MIEFLVGGLVLLAVVAIVMGIGAGAMIARGEQVYWGEAVLLGMAIIFSLTLFVMLSLGIGDAIFGS